MELSAAVAALYKQVGYEPHTEKLPILASRKRFILIAGGDQSGKSLVASKVLLARHFEAQSVGMKPRLYWLVAADYERTRREFEYLVEDFEKLGLLDKVGTTKRVDPGVIVLLDGTRIETKSANDPRTLAMKAPDGVLGCEASQFDVETYRRLSGRVAPLRGWLVMGGSFESSLGWYPGLYKAWLGGYGEAQSFSLPTWSNRELFPGGREDAEIKRLEAESSDAWFLERVAGVPCPPQGLVFPEVREDIHVQEIEWGGEKEEVYLWEDPGYGTRSAHALYAVQIMKDGQVQVFDEIYEQGLITKDIIGIAKTRAWWKSPKSLTSDPQYKEQHHSMPSVAEEWLRETGLVADGERAHILPGIERMKGFLKPDPLTLKPGLVFSPRCKGILSELGLRPFPLPGPRFGQTCVYHWKTDKDGNTIGETPEDEYNHGCKAISYGLLARFGWGHIEQDEAIMTYLGDSQRRRSKAGA